jgi:CBS domain-containing protein
MGRLYLAKEIMVTKIVTLEPSTPVSAGIARLLEKNITGAPVVSPGWKYEGMFSEKCCMELLTGGESELRSVRAADVMATELATLSPDMDAFDAIWLLLDKRVSGAPVVDQDNRFLGVFSEKTSMSVLLGAAYDQLPSSSVEAFMDRDTGRLIDEATDLPTMAAKFQNTHYRRLPVLRDGVLIGQVSRRDVLRKALNLKKGLESRTVGEHADTQLTTITEDLDLLSIVSVFRNSHYRRAPVMKADELKGIVSRRDVLNAARKVVAAAPRREQPLLYLSALGAQSQAATS